MARKTPGIYIAIRGDYSAFETDLNRARLVAKEQGEAIAKSIGNAVSKADLTGGINKLTRELKTAQTALSSGAFKAQVSDLDEIAKAAGVSSKQLEGLTNSMLKSQAAATANRAFEYLQKNAGLSTLQLAKLRVELGDMSGALSTLATGVKAHAVGMLAFGAAAAMAGKQVLDASLQMDRLNKAYATITGSSSAAQNQLDYMYDVTQRLGLQFQGTAEAAKGFFAAGKDSALTDHLNGIFESVSMAGSALALSKDQMDGVFLALGQMISKGKVQAEELRGQLGERLPGAFDMAAKAMGVTTAKLDDMLKKGQVTAEEMLPKLAKVLHDDFAVAAAEASQGLQGQLNRLSTEWTRFQASLLNGDAAAKVMKQLASGMKVLADHGAEIASIVGKGIQWAVWTAGVYAAIKALSGLRAAVTAAKAALVAFNVSSVAAAVGSLSGLLGPAGLAAAVGAAAVAFTSLSGSPQSTDEIFQKHQATIDAYKKRMGEAQKSVESFSEAQGIAQVASQTAGSLLDLAGALPEQIRQNALSGLETSTWSAGRGVSDASWNFQWWKEGMAEERLEEAAQDMRNQMTAVAQQVFSNAGISQFFDTFDVTTDEGLQKASTALSAISAVRSATDAIKSPLSELEQQAQSAKAQLDAWTQGMKDSGVNAQYAAGLINEYRNAFINDYIKTLDESLHPLSAYAQAVKAANEAVDQRKKALEIIGATEGQLAQVEAMRAEVVKQATEEMLRSFDQSVEQRWAAVNGNGDEVGRSISQANELRETIRQFGEGSAQVSELMKLHAAETAKAAQEMLRSFEQSVAQRWATVNGNADEVNRAISQENELRDTILKFGESSAQVAALLKLHAAETAKAAQDAAKSEYDSLKAQMDALEQQRVQLQQQAIQEQINAINEQLSAAKTLKSTWEGLDKSLGQSRYNLFAGSANLDAENRLGTVQAEFRRLSGLALGGDSDAAGQLAGVGTSLLDIVKQTAGTEEEYLDAFWAVNAQLKSAQDAAGAQVSAADKQLEALQGQLDVQNAALAELQGQSATLEEIEKQIADLKPLLDAAGQKAGVKAFARGGLAMPGWAVVGEEGPELVNFSQPGRVYTAADTAALFRSVTPRAADTDSGSDAEVKALRREVYQLRRDMLISMSEIARFSRRTSDMVEAWDAEGMPGVRA